MVLKGVIWVHNAKIRSYGLKRSQLGTICVRVSLKDKLLRSFVLFKFIDVDTCLQLIMYVFPMEVHLQLSVHELQH